MSTQMPSIPPPLNKSQPLIFPPPFAISDLICLAIDWSGINRALFEFR